jgi:hypothetical protein
LTGDRFYREISSCDCGHVSYTFSVYVVSLKIVFGGETAMPGSASSRREASLETSCDTDVSLLSTQDSWDKGISSEEAQTLRMQGVSFCQLFIRPQHSNLIDVFAMRFSLHYWYTVQCDQSLGS